MPEVVVAARPEDGRIPWYLWCAAVAVTSAYIGGYWDISWHRSIGRDTFWSPPHLAIYACGVLARPRRRVSDSHDDVRHSGAAAGRERSHLGASEGRLARSSARGAASPCSTSAPFDDWWHNAYGLDVKIISPPHMVLALGFFGINFGAVMLMLAFLNRAGRHVAPAAAAHVPLRRRHGSLRVAAAQAGIHQPLGDARARRSTRSSCSARSASSPRSARRRVIAGAARF